MLLKDFSVIHAQPETDVVVLNCWHDRQMVLAFNPKIHLQDVLRRDRLTSKQANLVVDRNLDVSLLSSQISMNAANIGLIQDLARRCHVWTLLRELGVGLN